MVVSLSRDLIRCCKVVSGGATRIGPHEVCRDVACRAMQPACDAGTSHEQLRFRREHGEDVLSRIPRQLAITRSPQGCSHDEALVSPDQFGEGRFGTVLAPGSEKA